MRAVLSPTILTALPRATLFPAPSAQQSGAPGLARRGGCGHRARNQSVSCGASRNLLEATTDAQTADGLPQQAAAALDVDSLLTLGVPAGLQSALAAVGALVSDVDVNGTSYVWSHVRLASFLDRALRVAAEQESVATPALPLLILNVISRLRFGSDAAAAPYRMLYQRAAAALMDAADVAGVYQMNDPTVMSPQEVLEYFECAGRMGEHGAVYKGSGFGHLLAHHIAQRSFSHQHMVRLLEAWATLRTACGYNPCVLNFRRLGESLVAAAPSLAPEELLRVIAACRAFDWPVYSGMAILEGVCAATLVRVSSGELPAPAGRRVLNAAADAAGQYRPGLRDALRAKLAQQLPELLAGQAASQRAPQAASGPLLPRQRAPQQAPLGAPANNAVVGPGRRKSALLALPMLPAAALLALPALPESVPPLATLISVVVVASLLATHDV